MSGANERTDYEDQAVQDASRVMLLRITIKEQLCVNTKLYKHQVGPHGIKTHDELL